MSEQAPTPHTPEPGQQSPEELVAALNASEADAMATLLAELATLKAKSADMADQYLRAKADAENARRRAEDAALAKTRAEGAAYERAKAISLALTPEAVLALAAKYRQGAGVERSASWRDDKGDFTNKMERIQFRSWLVNQCMDGPPTL